MIRDLHVERGNKPLFKTLLNIVAYDQGQGFAGCDTMIQNAANGPVGHLGIDISETLTADYNLFPPDERQRVYPLPAHTEPFPVFAEAFTDVVHENAERPALSQGDRQFTYAQLDKDATNLAMHLQERGVRVGESVAVVFSRSLECAVAAVALFKLGACYVPVDPDLPEARIEFIFDDAEPAVVIVAPGSQLKVEVAAEKLLWLSAESLSQLSTAHEALALFDHGLPSYLIYTSGSTGHPKGVEVTHRNLVPIARTAIHAAQLQPGARVLQFIAAGFDMSVLEIMMTLLAGSELVITDKVTSAPGKALAKIVKQEVIDLMIMTPSLLACHQTEDFPQDTVLMLGGEACTPALLARFSHCHLINVYGPTETSFPTSINTDYGIKDLSIGSPTANTHLYVVDSYQQVLPPGAWGDLFIAGPGVARGYRNLPELTGQSFVPDLLDSNSIMYRAGDRVSFDHMGRIHYLGRHDNQIKLRGLCIELDEIKNVLLGCPGVDDAAVFLKELAHGPSIIGYVVSKDNGLDSKQLKQNLRRHLPQYMVPSEILRVDTFPLTPNGKLAVDHLPIPAQIHESQLVPAETPEEAAMCKLYPEVLNCLEVFANQSFFDLGGHSLLGLQLVNRIREHFGIALSIADFHAAPTPRELAQRLHHAADFSDTFGAVLAFAPRIFVHRYFASIPLEELPGRMQACCRTCRRISPSTRSNRRYCATLHE